MGTLWAHTGTIGCMVLRESLCFVDIIVVVYTLCCFLLL